MRHEAGAPRACLWLSTSPPSPFIMAPLLNAPGSQGGHKRGGAGVMGSSYSVIYNTAIADKTDRERQKNTKQKQGPEGLE